MYLEVLCFNNIASDYFQKRFRYSNVEAGMIISITYGIAAVLCPFFGKLVDKIGKRATFILASNFTVLMFHVLMLASPNGDKLVYPVFYMILLGVGYSIYASVMWACIPYLVEDKMIGTGFGVTTSFMNLGTAVGSVFVGLIQEKTNTWDGYYWVSVFFVVNGVFGMLSAGSLYLSDRLKGGVINAVDPKSETQKILN